MILQCFIFFKCTERHFTCLERNYTNKVISSTNNIHHSDFRKHHSRATVCSFMSFILSLQTKLYTWVATMTAVCVVHGRVGPHFSERLFQQICGLPTLVTIVDEVGDHTFRELLIRVSRRLKMLYSDVQSVVTQPSSYFLLTFLHPFCSQHTTVDIYVGEVSLDSFSFLALLYNVFIIMAFYVQLTL